MAPDVLLSCLLVPGGAFLQEYQFNDEDPKRRFFFILNRTPNSDDQLILVTATSQVRKRLKYSPPEAVVIVSPTEYTPFSKKTAIDCTGARSVSKDEVIRSVRCRSIEILAPLPANIMERIKAAISVAATVPAAYKKLVLGADDSS